MYRWCFDAPGARPEVRVLERKIRPIRRSDAVGKEEVKCYVQGFLYYTEENICMVTVRFRCKNALKNAVFVHLLRKSIRIILCVIRIPYFAFTLNV